MSPSTAKEDHNAIQKFAEHGGCDCVYTEERLKTWNLKWLEAA
jgi:hypothetical protein